jgi:hypothetical protein
MTYQIVCLALGGVLPMTSAWSQATSPASLHSGLYPLQAFHGKSLPADISVPPKATPDGKALRSCQELVTSGSLTLDIGAGHFSFGYDVWDACSRTVVLQQTVSGTFEQYVDELVFHVSRESPRFTKVGEWTFTGSVGPSRR